jgi:iron complex transport system ATP-binding protein
MLELDDVGFYYRRGTWVFRKLNTSVADGGVLALVGPNGSGKSTLLRCIAGLLTPKEGEIRRSGSVGFVPQLHAANLTYTVFEMVLMGRTRLLKAYESPGRADALAARAALARVGLLRLAERPYASLSGGERQLVLIARAIAGENDILALDEPVSALDLRNEKEVLALVSDLAREGHTVALSFHRPEHALAVAGQAAAFFGDGVARVGPCAELLTDALLGRLYGVHVRTVDFRENGTTRHAIVTW